MRNKVKTAKRLLSLLLVFLFSINSFAAIVSDNDGSAFVTKAEFDALKQNFNKQIDDYNASIDGKIDGAIASYLAGIRLSVLDSAEPYISGLVWSVAEDHRPRYKYAAPQAWGTDYGYDYNNTEQLGHHGFLFGWSVTVDESKKKPFKKSTYGQSKLWIDNLIKSGISGASIAAWKGYDIGAMDEVDITHTHIGDSMQWSDHYEKYAQVTRTCKDWNFEDVELKGQCIFDIYRHDELDQNAANNFYIYFNKIKNYYGTTHMENIVLFNNSLPYDCFSNKDETKNWRYDGTHENLYKIMPGVEQTDLVLPDIEDMFNTGADTFSTIAAKAPVQDHSAPSSFASYDTSKKMQMSRYGLHVRKAGDPPRAGKDFLKDDKWLYVGAGFETKYLTDFNQLYNPNLDVLADDMVRNSIKGHNTLLTEPSSSIKHIGLNAGLPIVQLKSTQTVRFVLKVRDILLDTNKTSASYGTASDNTSYDGKMYVWAKTSPFTTADPNGEADLEITGTNVTKCTASGYDKGYQISGGVGTLNIRVEENCIVWIKWSMDNKKGGGVVEMPDTVDIISEG